MSYSLTEINFKTIADPKGFIEECDARYNAEINDVAERIIAHIAECPIVLLSGPSGSGKTTTSMKIAERLRERGVNTYHVGMDDYFKTIRHDTVPRTPEGDMDLESPLCLDMDLLNKHFSMLEKGERIFVPKYEFSRQMRIQEPSKSIKLKKDEVVVFEGIHALNDMITDVHPEAFKLYISAKSNVEFEGKIVFHRYWFRLVRRTVRDAKFRGTDPNDTLRMWANVIRGEKNYIAPFKKKADYRFDSSFAYEPPVFNAIATELFRKIPKGIEKYENLRKVLPALQLFGHISEDLVAPDALVREFLGGGIYEY